MANIQGNLKKIYDGLTRKGIKGIGKDLEEFSALMAKSEDNRKKVYNGLVRMGIKGIGKDFKEFNSFVYEPLQQTGPAKGFFPGMKEGAKNLAYGALVAAGETAKRYLGSQNDYAHARDMMQIVADAEMQDWEELKKWQQGNKQEQYKRSNGGLFKAPQIKGIAGMTENEKWDYAVKTKYPGQKLMFKTGKGHFYEALEGANGNVQEALALLQAKAGEEQFGDRIARKGMENLKTVRPTEGGAAWIGGMIPQMAGNLAALATAASPWTRWLSKPLATANTAALTASSAGSAMAEAREAGATDEQVWLAGMIAGGIEALTEYIPYKRIGRIFKPMFGKAGKLLNKNAATKAAAENELKELLKRADGALSKKLLNGKTAKEFIKDMGTEGASEFTAEFLGTFVPVIYESPEKFPTFKQAIENGWEGAKGGIFMGGFLGGASRAVTSRAHNKRRKEQGKVILSNTNDGIVEVLGYSDDGSVAYVMDPTGEQKELSLDALLDTQVYTYEQWKMGDIDAKAESLHDTYTAAAQATGPDERAAIAKELEESKAELERVMGVPELPEGMTGEELTAQAEQAREAGDDDLVDAIERYNRALAADAGAKDTATHEMESAWQQSDAEVDRITNVNTGMVTPVTLVGGGQGHITRGWVVVDEQGFIDEQASDETLYVTMADSRVVPVTPQKIASVDQIQDAEEAKAARRAEIEQMTMGQFNGNNLPQNDNDDDKSNIPAGGQIPERVPKDELGYPIYEQADTDTAWDAIVEQTEGDAAMAQTVVDGMVADKEAALKKLENAKAKGGVSIDEKIAAEKERKAAIDAAKQELDIRKKIAGTANRRKMEADAERIERETLNGIPDMVDDTARRQSESSSQIELDENGHPFIVSSDGTTIFGEITDDTGLPSAPIKLSEGIVDENGNGYGLQHIEARHGEQIRNAGFKSVEDFVKYVAENYDKDNIKVGKRRVNGSGTFIIQIEDEHANLLYIELSRDGSYWNVNSGGVFRKGYSEKRKNVEPNTELSTSDTASSDKSFVQTDSVDGSKSADTHSDNQRFSANEDTAPVSNMQENEQKSGENSQNEGETNTTKAELQQGSLTLDTENPAFEAATEQTMQALAKTGVEVEIATPEMVHAVMGLAVREEVNVPEFHRVYHGSGAKFDRFDHSHMGEGAGAQAYGWGTYVTEVEGIGRTYADKASGNIFKSGFGDFYLKEIKKGLAEGKSLEDVKQNLLEYHAYLYEKTGGNRKLYGEFMSDYERLQSLKEEDLLTRNLYTVEIPGDNGSNYLYWGDKITDAQRTMLVQAAQKEGVAFDFYGDEVTVEEYFEKMGEHGEGFQLYRALERALGSDKAASEFLNRAGFVGISYPAQATTGGREDGARNYVIFDENDAQITDHVAFLRTADGTVYGWTVGGKIYLTPEGVNPNTPVHEYTHLWASAVEKSNSELWARIVDGVKQSEMWREVAADEAYRDIWNDDNRMASEVLSRLSGEENYRRAMEKAEAEIKGETNLLSRIEKQSAWNRVKRALGDFWNSVKDLLGRHSNNATQGGMPAWEEFVNMTIGDFYEGVNPNAKNIDVEFAKKESERRKEKNRINSIIDEAVGFFTVGGKRQATKNRLKRESAQRLFPEIREGMAETEADTYDEREARRIDREITTAVTDSVDGSKSADTHSDNQRFSANEDTAPVSNMQENEQKSGENSQNEADTYDEREARRIDREITTAVTDLARELGQEVEVITDVADIRESHRPTLENKRMAKGWYDVKSGRVVIVLPNIANVQDAVETVLHEVVGHKGLRALMGERFNEMLDDVFNNGSKKVRAEIMQRYFQMLRKGGNGDLLHTATEEYIAEQAERGFADYSLLDRIKASIRGFLRSLGVDVEISDNEIRYMLWRSYRMQQKKNGVVGEVENKLFEQESMTGNYRYRSQAALSPTGAKGSALKTEAEIMNIRDRYEKRMQSGMYQGIEAAQDSMRSLLEFQRMIEKETGKEIPDWMNAYYMENALSSVNKAQQDLFARTYLKDIISAVDKLKNQGMEVEKIEDYLMVKHGIERNRDMAVKKAIERAHDTKVVNAAFNKALETLTEKNARSITLNLGAPSAILRAAGVEDKPIRLYGAKLMAKARKHGYSITDITNLPEAIQNPVAVFKGSQEGSHAILTVLKIGGKNVLVSLSVGKGGHDVDFNIVSSVYGKNEDSIARWINNGKLLFTDKKKALDYLSVSAPIAEAQDNQELSSAAKVVENFENPKIKEENAAYAEWREIEKDIWSRNLPWAAEQRMLDAEARKFGANLKEDFSGLSDFFRGKQDFTAAAYSYVNEVEQGYDTKDLLTAVHAATDAILEIQYSSGVMSKKTREDIQNQFRYYVPLRGFDATTTEEVYSYLTSNTSPLAKTKIMRGRKSKADSPLAWIANMADSAIVQGNRNRMKLAFLNLVMMNPTDLVSIDSKPIAHLNANGVWQIESPDIPTDATPEQIQEITSEFYDRMRERVEKYPDEYKYVNGDTSIPYVVQEKQDMREHQVFVRRNGKLFTITVNGNPRLAQAINGLTNPDVDVKGAVRAVFDMGTKMNRELSALYTTRNPAFLVKNFARDTWYSNIIVWIKEGAKYALGFNKNSLKYNPKKMFELIGKHINGTLDLSIEEERLFHELIMNGGETGYTNIKDTEAHKKKIAKELSKGGLRQGADAVGLLIDEVNRAVENSARFAAYVTSRQEGRSITRSIYDAKEITVNFNKKGAGDKFYKANGQTWLGNFMAFNSGLGRLLYIFWNAGIQGTTNFARVVKHNPKKGATLIAVLHALGALAASLFDDDEEYMKIPAHVRRNNFIFRLPGMDGFTTIPLPVEFRALYGIGEYLTNCTMGKEEFSGMTMAELFSQILPLDIVGEGGSAFVPSLAKPFVEAYITNKNFVGLPIAKANDFNNNLPEYQRVYKNTGAAYVEFSRMLNELGGGNKHRRADHEIWEWNPARLEHVVEGILGGTATTANQMLRTIETIFGEREYEPRNIPFLSSFYYAPDERAEQKKINGIYYENIEDLVKFETEMRGWKRDAKDRSLSEEERSEAKKKYKEMVNSGGKLYKRYRLAEKRIKKYQNNYKLDGNEKWMQKQFEEKKSFNDFINSSHE